MGHRRRLYSVRMAKAEIIGDTTERSMSGNKALIHQYLAAYTAFDVPAMLRLLAPDVEFENYSDDQLTASAQGITAFRDLAEQSCGLFAEREQRLTALREWPDRALAGIAFRGVLAVDIPGGPTAGTVIELDGKTEFSFRDGRIVRIVDRA